ncbi:MAG: hypothetical protein AAFQ36_02275 [Pseudomonadota bacterium]
MTFDPYLPLWILAAFATATVVILGYAGWRGLTGAALRFLAALIVLIALANPSLREEERTPLTDIAFLVVDETASQGIDIRPDQIAEAEAALTERLNRLATDPDAPLELRVLRVTDSSGIEGGERGTFLMTALEAAAAEVAPDRIAGAMLLSDGQLHDIDHPLNFPAPIHLFLTGRSDEWDRRLVVEQAPAFGIVGEEVAITIRAENLGVLPEQETGGRIPMDVLLDGQHVTTVPVPVGEDISFNVAIERAGQNVLELSLPTGDGELTARNNAALVPINGVRDRLRVLLVSGEPHPGGRTWRNLLKADPSVDLVHFTILRPPTKQDGTPVFEMSLIAFPTRELFMEKIDEFDLIIFDRYRRRGVLPVPYLANIERYVSQGGAVLIASGPAFAGVESLYRTPLRVILPAEPTTRVIEEGFLPQVTELGRRHPVTTNLEAEAPRPPAEDGTPGWGRWFRMIELDQFSGDTVMNGVDEQPLLILDRHGEGRVALLASDHAWLWSRGYEGGGPQLELLRRLAHWLMQEPELEEDVLIAEPDADGLMIERRSLRDISPTVTVTQPDGETLAVTLAEVSPGRWQGRADFAQDGLYRLAEGDLKRVVAVGPSAPREFANAIASAAVLQPVLDETGGGVARMEDGLPTIRRVQEGRNAEGRGWIGLVDRDAYQVADVRLTSLAPGWLVLLLIASCIVGAWRVEGR